MKTRLFIYTIFLAAFLMRCQLSVAQQLPLFFISIGSGHYQQKIDPFSNKVSGFDNVEAACLSAKNVAALLSTNKMAQPMRLISNDSSLVTRNAIIDSTGKLMASAFDYIANTGRQACVLFYYCGHGIMNDSTKTFFIIPGNINTENVENLAALNVNAISVQSLVNESMRKAIEWMKVTNKRKLRHLKSKVSFIFLFDCCYNTGKTNNAVIDSLNELMKISLEDDDFLHSIGGLDVTNIADGIAHFLVERVKNELYSSFTINQYFNNPIDLASNLFHMGYAVSPGNYALVDTVMYKGKELDVAPIGKEIFKLADNTEKINYNLFISSLKLSGYSNEQSRKRKNKFNHFYILENQ